VVARWPLVALLLAGCYNYVTDSFVSNDFSGDAFPDNVELTSGAIVVGLQPDGASPRIVTLDVLSPFTILDNGPDTAPAITYPGLTLLGAEGPGGALDRPRGHFNDEPQVLALHECTDPQCQVGEPGVFPPRPIEGVLGMSAFSSDALRLHLDPADPEMFVLPDIAGDEYHRSQACDAVLPTPFRGGGSLIYGGTEINFTNWRIAIDTCLAPNPDPDVPQPQRGTDVLLVASTGVGISLLGESAYIRYQQADTTGTVPLLTNLPAHSVFLPSGLVAGHLASIPKIALVGNWAPNPRAPCRQVYASHVLASVGCLFSTDPVACPCTLPTSDPQRADKCPCQNGAQFCGVPGVVELSQTIRFLIVSDDDPTLQALRAELRPDRPEVDGILGAEALQNVEVDIDYPHDRLLGRCFGPGCDARPEMSSTCELARVQECLGLPANQTVTNQLCGK
jgi:hypothetical protein